MALAVSVRGLAFLLEEFHRTHNGWKIPVHVYLKATVGLQYA